MTDKIGLAILRWTYGKKSCQIQYLRMPLEKKGEYKVPLMPWCIFTDYKELQRHRRAHWFRRTVSNLKINSVLSMLLCHWLSRTYRRKKSEIVECLINEGLTILWLRAVFTLLICVLDVRVAFNGDIFFWDAEEWHS